MADRVPPNSRGNHRKRRSRGSFVPRSQPRTSTDNGLGEDIVAARSQNPPLLPSRSTSVSESQVAETGGRSDGAAEVDQIVALLAHELRTPLTSIRGFAQLSARRARGDQDAVNRYSTIIVNECDRIASILSDLVMATYPADFENAPSIVELGEVVQAVVTSVSDGTESGGNVQVVDGNGWPSVNGAREQLAQLMTYFVQSMMKYRDNDLPITLRATRAGGEVIVSAELAGSAPLRRLGHLFEAAPESNAEQRGSGLGLYICKRFCETRGGRMWMERWGDEDDGARICFSLPTAAVHTHR